MSGERDYQHLYDLRRDEWLMRGKETTTTFKIYGEVTGRCVLKRIPGPSCWKVSG